MLEIRHAKTGFPYLVLNGIALHSPYDPLKEAERFLSASISGERPGTILILGNCLGYLGDIAKKKYPFSKVVNIYSRQIYDAAASVFRYSDYGSQQSFVWHLIILLIYTLSFLSVSR